MVITKPVTVDLPNCSVCDICTDDFVLLAGKPGCQVCKPKEGGK